MVAMKYRCACTTLKGRRCRNSFSFICNKTRVCYIHANAYLKYVLTIQKVYKAYRCRKYVRLLARLPCDIQEIILFYMREHLYNARRNQCIKKILCKKVDTLIGIPKNILDTHTKFKKYFIIELQQMGAMHSFNVSNCCSIICYKLMEIFNKNIKNQN